MEHELPSSGFTATRADGTRGKRSKGREWQLVAAPGGPCWVPHLRRRDYSPAASGLLLLPLLRPPAPGVSPGAGLLRASAGMFVRLLWNLHDGVLIRFVLVIIWEL